MATPDTILQTQGLASIKSENILITPTGGSQVTLGDALAAGGGSSGPVAATTLTASGNVTLSPTGTVTISPSSTAALSPVGKLTINPTAASVMDNVKVGATTPLAGTFTVAVATSLTITGNVSLTATKVGFYNAAAVSQQTGVAVDAAGIHAALVNLGLITA